jgi:hypothetical protein
MKTEEEDIYPQINADERRCKTAICTAGNTLAMISRLPGAYLRQSALICGLKGIF